MTRRKREAQSAGWSLAPGEQQVFAMAFVKAIGSGSDPARVAADAVELLRIIAGRETPGTPMAEVLSSMTSAAGTISTRPACGRRTLDCLR